MEAKKKPAKNDKTERNIIDFAIDLMAAQRSCPICERPLWKPPEEIIPQGFCMSAVVAPAAYSVSLTATPLSSCRPLIIPRA